MSEYDASRIKVLEGWEAVRLRPGMYVGSTGERGLHNLVIDVAERAVDEVLTGRARRVSITLMPNGGVRIADDGPGISAADLDTQLTRLNSTAGPRDRRTPGFGSLGLFVANCLSSRLTAEVRREGVRWVQKCARGTAITPPTDAGPASGSGTTITFWPDPEIFGTTRCSFDELVHRFRELALLNRGLDISLSDQRTDETRSERFRFPGGVRDFVALLDSDSDIIGFEREDSRMAGTMEVALRWGSGPTDGQVRGFANSRPTLGGGTHETGFREGLAAALSGFARERGFPEPEAGRIAEGLTAVVSVKLDEPTFEGAVRDRLGNSEVRACVAQAVREHVGTWLAEHPEQGRTIIERISRD